MKKAAETFCQIRGSKPEIFWRSRKFNQETPQTNVNNSIRRHYSQGHFIKKIRRVDAESIAVKQVNERSGAFPQKDNKNKERYRLLYHAPLILIIWQRFAINTKLSIWRRGIIFAESDRVPMLPLVTAFNLVASSVYVKVPFSRKRKGKLYGTHICMCSQLA